METIGYWALGIQYSEFSFHFEFPILNTEYPMLNLKPLDIGQWLFIIQNPVFFEYPIPNTEYPMLNLKPLDIGHWVFNIQNSVFI